MNSKTGDQPMREWEKLFISIDKLERDRVRDDLHDGLGQIFTSLAFRLYGLKRRIDEKPDPAAEEIREISRLVTVAKNELNYLHIASGPGTFAEDSYDLATALKSLASMAEARLNIPCTFKCDEDITIGSLITVVQLYRIAQDFVTGSARYMKPDRLTITLNKKADHVFLTIECHTCKISDKVDIYNDIVIKLLRDRAELINATLKMHGTGEEGITVVCSTPEEASGYS